MNKPNMSVPSDVIKINIGGRVFETYLDTLQKYPETRLGLLTTTANTNCAQPNNFFFDRNPDLFGLILDFYRYDDIHVPTGVCGSIIKRELQFWGLEPGLVSDCCLQALCRSQNNVSTHAVLRKAFEHKRYDREYRNGCCGTYRQALWMILEYPSSSRAAKVYNFFNFLFTAIYICWFFMEQTDDFRTYNIPQFSSNNASLAGSLIRVTLQNKKFTRVLFSEPHVSIIILGFLCYGVFTLDTIVRFWAAPTVKRYFSCVFNILDVVAFICISTFYALVFFGDQTITVLRVLRWLSVAFLIRLLRAIRFTMQFETVIVLKEALKHSAKELLLLASVFIMGSILFGCIMYNAEFEVNDNFDYIYSCVWWAIITMTTVGYGDMVPKSTTGYIVGSMCAGFGLVLMAMPVAIIASNYSDFHSRNQERQLRVHNVTKVVPVKSEKDSNIPAKIQGFHTKKTCCSFQ